MKVYQSWVPGYATVPQDMGAPWLAAGQHPGSDVTGYRQGAGVTFYLHHDTENWFHIPIPTLTVIEDLSSTPMRRSEAKLRDVMILFRIPEGAWLRTIGVFDGTRNVFWHDYQISGDHSQVVDTNNKLTVDSRPTIKLGMGISVNVHCVQDSDIFFAGAGAIFLHDI